MLEHVPCWWQIGIIEIIETCSTSFWLLDPILGYLHAGDQCQLVSLPQQVVFNHLRVPYLEPKTEGNLQEMETNTWKSAEIRRNPPFAAYFSMTTGGKRRSPERQRRETPRHIAAMNARDRPWKPGQLLRILEKAESERRKWRFWINDGWDMIWYDNGDEVYDMFGDILKGFEYFHQIIDRAKGRTKLQRIFHCPSCQARILIHP